jgi:2-polyprenyl-3-methyl-5-hydroxy-6-metoxy-1,4-benzoquinol methylase
MISDIVFASRGSFSINGVTCLSNPRIKKNVMDKEQFIIQSWQANADNWIRIIESEGIESRKLVTNQAIINAITAVSPGSVFDIGCGEGWLAKELSAFGITVCGVDIIPELIASAKEKVSGNFFVASYEDIYSYTFKIRMSKLFDAIVINFALLGKESSENLLASLPAYLLPAGKLFIQTLHPHHRMAINDYASGWKEGSWTGLGENFTMPYEWYFRTMEDWLLLLEKSGFHKIRAIETTHPQSGQLLSVIFECGVK